MKTLNFNKKIVEVENLTDRDIVKWEKTRAKGALRFILPKGIIFAFLLTGFIELFILKATPERPYYLSFGYMFSVCIASFWFIWIQQERGYKKFKNNI